MDKLTQLKVDRMLQKKSSEAIMVLTQLIKAGLRKGECSPNDIINRDISQKNVIGAVFGSLKALGFTQTDRRVVGSHASQHCRKVFVWKLQDSSKARYFIDKCAGMAFGNGETKYIQKELF